MKILHVKSIKLTVFPLYFLAISAVLSLLYHHCYSSVSKDKVKAAHSVKTGITVMVKQT